ncbi:MAG TPA: DUF488 domain-containing protein [bacterium]
MLTIGHSNRPLEVFLELLRVHAVALVADVRTVPRSRHNPQFNRETLPGSLAAAGIGYRHLAALGGLRHPRADSPNAGWRNESFRGFADYMQTPAFDAALAELIGIARETRTALLCAEALPWRCHRSLIADALLAHGVPVAHIMSGASPREHSLTPFARVRGTQVTYPEEAPGGQPQEPQRGGRPTRARGRSTP